MAKKLDLKDFRGRPVSEAKRFFEQLENDSMPEYEPKRSQPTRITTQNGGNSEGQTAKES